MRLICNLVNIVLLFNICAFMNKRFPFIIKILNKVYITSYLIVSLILLIQRILVARDSVTYNGLIVFYNRIFLLFISVYS